LECFAGVPRFASHDRGGFGARICGGQQALQGDGVSGVVGLLARGYEDARTFSKLSVKHVCDLFCSGFAHGRLVAESEHAEEHAQKNEYKYHAVVG
jgi:hypothetical protein